MRQYINASRLITKIKMLRSGKSGKSFILVEGVTDYRFYSKFMDLNICEIIIADSKSNVTECISVCNREKMQGVLGIVDADFWRLDHQIPNEKNLFLTDFHDLECMLIHSPAYDNILAEYANRNKYLRFEAHQKKSLKDILLENGAKIGCLRWHSLQCHLGLSFSQLDFSQFTNPLDLEVDMLKLIQHVLKRSKKQNSLKAEELMKEIRKLYKMQEDLWEVCCGHDLIELLTIGLTTIFGEYNAKNLFPGNLEGSFRLTYEYDYFAATKLYQDLNTWQKKNHHCDIFADRRYDSVI